MPRPTAAELVAARDKVLPDLVAPGLKLLLVGINPGLWSTAAGYHFGNPANRLWRVLHLAGCTDRVLHPSEHADLLARGIGVTNVVQRATATAAELTADEIRAGRAPLEATVTRYQPAYVAFLGLTTYRLAFDRPKATVGPLPDPVAGRPAWLLPNPSGLNAHYQLAELVRLYAELRAAALI